MRFEALPGKFSHWTGDIRDRAAIDAAMASQPCDELVTLAAITADASRELLHPGMIFEVNVAGALNAIESAARHGISRFVHLSSGSVYGKSSYDNAPLDEINTLPRPEGLYGMSKLAAETATLRLKELLGIDLVIGRLGTCFGPWEHDTGFRDTLSAPLQLLQLAKGRQTAIFSYDSKRDWLYVRDAAAAIISLVKTRQLRHDIYNLASGFEFTLSSWCRKLQKCYPDFQWCVDPAADKGNVNLYSNQDRASMNIRRLLSETAFSPVYDLEAAFDDFMEWNKKTFDKQISD